MDHIPSRARVVLFTLLATVVGTAAGAQHVCYDQGSKPVSATVVPSPTLLGCAQAPTWPTWHLLTPAHRAPAPHEGFNPGDARAVPRLLVRYQCTGLLLIPVVPIAVHTMGYVIDRSEEPCVTS